MGRNKLDGTEFAKTTRGALLHDGVFDPNLKEVVVFGGADQGVDQNRTWLWNGTACAKLSTTASPKPREQFGTMWDPATQQFLIFGGYEFTTNTFCSDTSQLR